MENPIIDVSGATRQQSLERYGEGSGTRLYLWYRLGRPLLALSIWLMAAYYIYWCVTTAGKGEFAVGEFLPALVCIASLGSALIVWAALRRVGQTVAGGRDQHGAPSSPMLDLARDIVLTVGPTRSLVAYHDDDGLVSHVAPLQREIA